MPIIQENPTYFNDKSAVTSSCPLNNIDLRRQQQHRQEQQLHHSGRLFHSSPRKLSTTSADDTEDGSEMDTLLSSCESNNSSYNGSNSNTTTSRHHHHHQPLSNGHTSSLLRRAHGKRNGLVVVPPPIPPGRVLSPERQPPPPLLPPPPPLKSSGLSLARLGQLFKKSKSKQSVGSESGHGSSTVESSGLGSPTATPDSSLSIYTNSLDGDSHSSGNSNQISPKQLEGGGGEVMDDDNRFCSTYAFDDCGIFAANMYYNVGESSVFTIYHQHQNNHHANNHGRRGASFRSPTTTTRLSDRDDEFEDCVQPYYNNATFSTFPNPKRSSIASSSVASTTTTTSSFARVDAGGFVVASEKMLTSPRVPRRAATAPQHDGDGYLRPNEARNLRNVKNLYINDSAAAVGAAGQVVQQVQVDVHTPTSLTPLNQNQYSISDGFNSSAASSGGGRGGIGGYQFDSAESTTSAATTLVAGGSHNFSSFQFPEDETNEVLGSSSRKVNNSSSSSVPVYMNRSYFDENSSSSSLVGSHRKVGAAVVSVFADCEPYCSLCASSIMGSPRQRSKMDVAIVKCRECFFSREAETHVRGFFDKLMREDKQKMDVVLKSYDLKDLDHPTDRVVVHCAKVQIVIISHHFLQRLKDEASRRPRLSPINRVFRSKNVIAVLMAVTAKEVLDGYESVLPRFREWFSVDLRSTNKYEPEFCKKFTEQVIRIYNVELSNSSNFSVFPKKVTREQPKIAITFKKPVEQNDEVHIELKTARQVKVVSNIKMENPHVTLVRIPESISPDREAIIDVSVFVNKCKIGGSRIKSELNLRRFEEDELDRMAKVLPPFLDCVDKHISDTLQKHYKECTDYTADPDLELMNGIIICKGDILPTIMHFASYYGLSKTAFIVLDEADGLAHCNVRNELDETPLDIAFARGHTQIGQLIGEYQEISNSYKAYRYIKELMDKDTDAVVAAAADNVSEADTLENGADQENGEPGIEEVEQEEPLNQQDDEEEEEVERETEAELLESSPETKPDANNCNGVQTSPESTSARSEEDDEESELNQKPTPSTRRRLRRRGEYVNVDGNPGDNPEIVQTRVKKYTNSPEFQKRRRSMMPNYDVPRTRDQDYEVPPPEVRPVQQVFKRFDKSSPVLIKKNSGGPFMTTSGYLIMNDDNEEDPVPESILPKGVVPPPPTAEAAAAAVLSNGAEVGGPSSPPQDFPGARNGSIDDATNNNTAGSAAAQTFTRRIIPSANHQRKNAVPLDPADEQLIDLMNYFKDNTYDMHQIELLFESWKQRPDVKQSIEEKMKMLEQLRSEYRQLRQLNKEGANKKPSALDRIKTILTIKKKKVSNTNAPGQGRKFSEPFSSQRKLSESSANGNNGLSSSSGLTFTGPNLPPQPFNNTPPPPQSTPPPTNTHSSRIESESSSSYRTSIDSKLSDSSSDSDSRPGNEQPSSSSFFKSNQSPEYNNPLSKRFVPTYVSPNPTASTSFEFPESSHHHHHHPSTQSNNSSDTSYQVPPPPRPVKLVKKPVPVPVIPEEPPSPSPALPRKPQRIEKSSSPILPAKPPAVRSESTSPSVSPKPPAATPEPGPPSSPSVSPKPPAALPEEEPASVLPPVVPKKPSLVSDDSISLPNTPPALPAKPTPKYSIAEEPSSPPPQPPPRNPNAPNLFNYIDYKKKNQLDANKSQGNDLVKQSYENMESGEQEC